MDDDQDTATAATPGGPIVVGLDFSPFGERAFRAACAMAQDLDAGLVLVHAFPSHFIPAEVTPETAARLESLEAAADTKEAIALTTRWADEARRQGIEVATVAAAGEPARLILQAARDHKAAMIVVGTHGRSGITRALLGSVSEQVVRHSPYPVLMVPAPDNT